MTDSAPTDVRARIDEALAQMKRTPTRRSPRRRRPAWARGASVFVALTLALLALFAAMFLPFLALLGTSIRLYAGFGWHYVPSIATGVTAATAVVAAYVHFLLHRMRLARRFPIRRGRTAAFVVFLYTAWSLVFVSAGNVKSPEVRATYRATHPLLRLATSTLVVFDRDAVITDMQRTQSDYARMGLPVNETSLHFRQTDGFVHAIDLRTRGRTGVRNALTVGYFRLIGLSTLRHVGTADHLHVSLPNP